MSTSVPPRGGAPLTGSPASGASSPVIADEQALKRAFDANYSECLASAQSQLGDAKNLAARVVEVAFLNAWNQRAVFANADQLKAFLADEIRHGSARALSRRFSGHRMGAMGGGAQSETHAASQADAATVWASIERTIHGEGDNAKAHAAAATAGRHDAASHMKSVAKSRSMGPVIVLGVVALGVALAGAFYMNRLGEDDAVLSAVNAQGIQPIASSPGQIGTVVLGDGTKMRIGPETKVMIPDKGFPTSIRAVRVDGTASFEVAAGQQLLYVLSTGGNLGLTQNAAGFTGYIIAQCNFRYAHGFAFITDGPIGQAKVAEGYLALVMDDLISRRTGIASESLSQ